MKTKIDLNNKTILVTGAAGFIGYNLIMRLFSIFTDITVVAMDNLNDYYDPTIKEWRLHKIDEFLRDKAETSGNSWHFMKSDIAECDVVKETFAKYAPSVVVNLAAQAGVRYSITNPDSYIHSNLIGFYNILEACRHIL